jgi:peroxiredoxin
MHKVSRLFFWKYACLSMFFFMSIVPLQHIDAAGPVQKEIQPFILPESHGKNISLDDYPQAKGFIIVFTCNHCPFAGLYTSRLNTLYQEYQPEHIPLIAINPMDTLVYQEENLDGMRNHADSAGYIFPYLQDAGQDIAKKFGATHTPQAFILWKEKNALIVRYSGALDDNGKYPDKAFSYIRMALDELLQGRAVSRPSVPSFGCRIYYRK